MNEIKRLESIKEKVKEQEYRYRIAKEQEEKQMAEIISLLNDESTREALNCGLSIDESMIATLIEHCNSRDYDFLNSFVEKYNSIIEEKVSEYERICNQTD